jgi:hypothetical protein
VAGAAWRAAMRIVARVEDLVQRTGDGRTGRVAPCVICTVHVETRSSGFLVEPQNQCRLFVSNGLKTIGTVSHQFGPQNR